MQRRGSSFNGSWAQGSGRGRELGLKACPTDFGLDTGLGIWGLLSLLGTLLHYSQILQQPGAHGILGVRTPGFGPLISGRGFGPSGPAWKALNAPSTKLSRCMPSPQNANRSATRRYRSPRRPSTLEPFPQVPVPYIPCMGTGAGLKHFVKPGDLRVVQGCEEVELL